MMNDKMRQWSKLDPKPVLYFDPKSDTWLAVWNGIFMTAEHALLLTACILWGNANSKEMIAVADSKMERLYHLGVFNDVIPKGESWSGMVESGVSTYYNEVLPKHIKQHFSHLTHYESWLWFEKMLREKRK